MLQNFKLTIDEKLKYFEVWLDNKMFFRRHVVDVAKKIDALEDVLSKLTPNTMGPASSKSKVVNMFTMTVATRVKDWHYFRSGSLQSCQRYKGGIILLEN